MARIAKRKIILFKIDWSVFEALDRAAESAGLSRSAFVETLVTKAVARGSDQGLTLGDRAAIRSARTAAVEFKRRIARALWREIEMIERELGGGSGSA